MNIDSQQVKKLEIIFDAGGLVPPPFHFAYRLIIDTGSTATQYEIQYLHREELTEEEITDEGFTLEDDWKWEGKLPANWIEALLAQIDKQSWPKSPEQPNPEEAVLDIRLLNEKSKVLFEGKPADQDSWEYFLQEVIQAIYEVAEREAPFQLMYKEIGAGNAGQEIFIEASFAHRKITAQKLSSNGTEENTAPDWKILKAIMKATYTPEFDYEKASINEPHKQGKYLYTGEGLWFKFGDSLLEPGKDTKSLIRLEETLKDLFQ
jgi:hypothetical protein